jgi:hypothetical protein
VSCGTRTPVMPSRWTSPGPRASTCRCSAADARWQCAGQRSC